MIKNYLLVALRNMWKNKVHSGINLFGLAFGLACTILIALWIQRELSVDQFHDNSARLFKIMEHQNYSNGTVFTYGVTPGPLAPKLKEDFPEIAYATRTISLNRSLLSIADESFYESGLGVDPDFLQMFTFPVLEGERASALAGPNNILISESLAKKYFGSSTALGQTIRMNDREEYQVSGVFQDVPENSVLQFDFLTPVENVIARNAWMQNWNSNGVPAYVMTEQAVDAQSLSAKLVDAVRDNSGQDNVDLFVRSLSDVYLRNDFKGGIYQGGGRIEYVRLFGTIAIFILLIACINFMNLSTAKSASRSLEVGIRKVSGATRRALSGQFLSESVFLTVLAGLLGIGLASLALPSFNRLFALELSLEQAGLGFWIVMLVIILLTGLAAGSYPAVFLSRFQPVKVLKGVTTRGGGAIGLRKVLVTMQFVISIVLIISTLVVFKQIQFIKNKNLGYERENLLYVPVNGTLSDNYELLKAELLQQPDVASVSTTNDEIHNFGINTSGVQWPGKDPDESILFQTIAVSYDFIQTIGAKLRQGRDFSPDFATDSTGYIINQTAADLMNMDQPLNQSITLGGTAGSIIGVVDDFHVGSFRSEQDPVIMALYPQKSYIYLRTSAEADLTQTLATLEATFKKHNPAYPFEYYFTDQQYEKLYEAETRTGTLAKIFAFLAIFVSCLGLFGLASYATEQRRKEIGIRRILGATVRNLTGLLTKDFLALVLLAIVIASPIAWWATTGWLEKYAFHIDLHWSYFALAGLLAVGIAFVVVSLQGVKAALANPVESLRSE